MIIIKINKIKNKETITHISKLTDSYALFNIIFFKCMCKRMMIVTEIYVPSVLLYINLRL